MTAPPRLSVIVTITHGERHIDRCLRALSGQQGAPPAEIVVPVFPAIDPVEDLRRNWPSVCFLELSDRPPADPAHRHWQFDRRRAAGLALARGEIVAITEDHAIPRPDWCARILAAHAASPHLVIGGGIHHLSAQPLARAVFLCDFGRYQPPFAAGPAEYVSDVNVSYKRAALESCREVWTRFYHETAVHGYLRRAGHTLWLTPEIAVDYDRGRLHLGGLLSERFAWARVFAGRRAQASPLWRRVLLVLLSPGLPALLAARGVLLGSRRRRLAYALRALPAMLLLLAVWSGGELAGYWTARPFSGSGAAPSEG